MTKGTLLATTMALALTPSPRAAEACGGCFSPPDKITAVEAHRMVISLGAERTILWDQIRYSGDPEDFVWVLPVPDAAAEIELADPRFFDELDGQTAPTVTAPSPPPQLFCGDSAGFGCGDSLDGASADDSADAGPDVTVYAEDTVGPYETVTIGSESATALHDWLVEHGYNVPDATLPTIQWYADRRSVFVVLRLAPGQGVQAMQPVRVSYPGYMATFPLRMVTVGAQGILELSLWVIAEQRYETANYPTVQVPQSRVVWDWSLGRSTYREEFDAALQNAGGRAWVVEHASPLGALAIGAWQEVEVATQGIPYPYVTRLRTRVYADYLDEDLGLRPAAIATDVASTYVAAGEVNRPEAPDCDDDDGCALGVGRRARAVGLPMLFGVVLLLGLRRRRG